MSQALNDIDHARFTTNKNCKNDISLIGEKAKLWILDKEDDSFLSFNYICEAIGWDESWMRRMIQKRFLQKNFQKLNTNLSGATRRGYSRKSLLR